MLACKFANTERSCWLGANNFKILTRQQSHKTWSGWSLKFNWACNLHFLFVSLTKRWRKHHPWWDYNSTPLECASSSSPGFHLEAARERNKFELKVMLPWIGLKATSSLCSFHTLQAEKFQPLQQFKFQVSWCYVDASCIMRLLTFKTLLRKIAHIT